MFLELSRWKSLNAINNKKSPDGDFFMGCLSVCTVHPVFVSSAVLFPMRACINLHKTMPCWAENHEVYCCW